jgi:enoyl-CoA hydratase
MSDIITRKQGHIGRITLTRPHALNAVTAEMLAAIDAALTDWEHDNNITMAVIDAQGDKAFSAGGDIQDLYQAGTKGDYAFGQRFWHNEYRLNARIANWPKPYAAFMQGFTMGGGVGISCHGSHRIVCETSQIAMPEVGIGLVPDVGGSLILAQAPGRLGEYLGLTTSRMGPGDAILTGFADYFIPKTAWADLIEGLANTGDWALIDAAAQPVPHAPLSEHRAQIDRLFSGEGLDDIIRSLQGDDTGFAQTALKTLGRNSPLAMSCAVEMLHRLRPTGTLARALDLEYRFTFRAMEHGDFLEGIRAAIIDKDRAPKWLYTDASAIPSVKISQMLMPLGQNALNLEGAI